MLSGLYSTLMNILESLPVISTHEHHLPDNFHHELNLDLLLQNSYVKFLHTKPGDTRQSRKNFLSQCRYNSYFIWLEKSLQSVYGFQEKILAENWDEISSFISEKHSSSCANIDILRDKAGYHHAIQDSYWDYSSNNGHPDMFSPAMRTDMFVTGFHIKAKDHDGNVPFVKYKDAPTSNFDDFLDFLRDLFIRWKNAGGVTLKSASAYDRTLLYEEVDRSVAANVFYQHPENINPGDDKAYGDYMFGWFCRLAIELEVPFQIHTGMAKLGGSNPLLLEPVIARYPELRFVLLHAGYPWYDLSAGLARNHSNISIDMAWVPLLSTTGAIFALHEYLETVQSINNIAWGSDTWTSEEAYGALLAWRHVVARVLAEKVAANYFSMKDAEEVAHKLLYLNASRLYGIEL